MKSAKIAIPNGSGTTLEEILLLAKDAQLPLPKNADLDPFLLTCGIPRQSGDRIKLTGHEITKRATSLLSKTVPRTELPFHTQPLCGFLYTQCDFGGAIRPHGGSLVF